ncbi:MAG: hypothetical protein GY856_31535, partial [bacterium]|nr:hypothetical protein [bacterium]
MRKDALCLLSLLAFSSLGCTAPRSAPPAAEADHVLGAGFRYSVYGPEYDPGPSYWADVGERMAARFPGAVPEAIWIVGRLRGEGTELSFPAETAHPLIQFTEEDG